MRLHRKNRNQSPKALFADEYLRRGFESPGPLPTQDDLNRVVASATSVAVHAVPSDDLLHETSDPKDIAALLAALRLDEHQSQRHCMCFGDPAFVFWRSESKLGRVTLHHGESIRWEPFFWDAALAESDPVLNWLSSRGMHGAREEYDEGLRVAAEYDASAGRWRAAMPPALEGVHDPLSWQPIAYVDSIVAEALELEYPDPGARARVLFEWFGHGEGPWSGYPAYEGVPEQCLLELPLDALVEGARSDPQTEPLLEGAARFFAGWAFRRKRKKDLRKIPGDLKRVLLAHCLASTDEHARSDGKRAFGEWRPHR